MELYINVDVNIRNKISLNNSLGKTIIDEIIEINTVSQNELLKKSITNSDPEKYTIVLFSSIMTLLEPEQVTDYIEKIVNNINFDVFYLLRYSDDIRGHDEFKKIGNIETMKITSPHGIEALILSPNGKNILRDKLDFNEGRSLDYVMNAMCTKMNCYSSDPCIFSFDMKKRRNDYELVKGVLFTEAVHSIKPPSLTRKNTSSTNLFWFILVLVFILCAAGAMISLTDNKKGDETNSKNELIIQTPYNPTGEMQTYGNS